MACYSGQRFHGGKKEMSTADRILSTMLPDPQHPSTEDRRRAREMLRLMFDELVRTDAEMQQAGAEILRELAPNESAPDLRDWADRIFSAMIENVRPK
jgi:hypothetical protein